MTLRSADNGTVTDLPDALIPRPRRELAPGAVLVPDWLDPVRQRELVALCRAWAVGPVRMRSPRMPNGGVMSVQSVSLGWHWLPYRYSRTADDVGGAAVAPFPDVLRRLGRDAVAAAYGRDEAARYEPDAALVNYYDDAARMGMHQDREERTDAPVVSLSLGTSCVFRFGNTENRNRPWQDVELASGDLFVFGGPSRFAYHGVVRTLPGTAPTGIGFEGRLNITLRQTGLSGTGSAR
ncbi:alpha-ketoglutarate-dependent dioxygenase AlkB [Arthrobacter sp. KR32]|jgi:alkylated DNA repair protein (DNA oxidative demethylase)|uniref:Alpha-ketoglutarate-dependent dioxygenase AlkB n=1 Tax=Arthrobacter bussei TaxID=2594179 RepID=A0A7X1NP61_9MICC|nr:alpha-ketoglutarate-dependent dioxygenase AlkB [Arthrobacter bussei]